LWSAFKFPFNVNLTNTDLSDTNLSGANLSGAVLVHTNYDQSIYNNTNFYYAVLDNPEHITKSLAEV
jgi:uncharacterized protein YjbI with pentapeptide repeats